MLILPPIANNGKAESILSPNKSFTLVEYISDNNLDINSMSIFGDGVNIL